MKLGVFTPVFGALDVKAMLAKVQSLKTVQAIELGTVGRKIIRQAVEMPKWLGRKTADAKGHERLRLGFVW